MNRSNSPESEVKSCLFLFRPLPAILAGAASEASFCFRLPEVMEAFPCVGAREEVEEEEGGRRVVEAPRFAGAAESAGPVEDGRDPACLVGGFGAFPSDPEPAGFAACCLC